MIKGRSGRKTRFDRKWLNGRADGIDIAAARETETAFAGGQSAKQTDESRREQRETNRPSDRPLPLKNQILPQIWKHDEVGPDQDLEIIPNPRRGFEAERENKNGGRAENEGNF